jgi:hypothetical protein
VLDERATTQGIWDRLHWLLDGVRDGDQRMLFYSGHGARMPEYNIKGEPDHYDECLVPYDFDWSRTRAILDNQFYELYSQLPYGSYFVGMFDCCHSGGITREGGPRMRGITPPDDIRHRALRWEAREEMWIPRDFPPLNDSIEKQRNSVDYVGSNGATRRFGRAMILRTQSNKEYDKTRKELGHFGPYLPILLEACQETQFSYEYRDGATSYGAYTFCMAKVLRTNRARGVNLSFQDLNKQVTAKLHRLKYDQTPNLVGAEVLCAQAVPWTMAGQKTSPKRSEARGRKKLARRKRRQ